MAAITWRNVESASGGAEASDILRNAGTSMNAGIGTLERMLKQREAVQAANWEAGKVNNTQTVLDAMAAAKTPEQMAALEASGELGRMQAGFNGQVDREKLRGAASAQLNTLRQQENTTNIYNDGVLARKEAPVNDRIGMLIAQKDYATARKELGAVDLKGESKHWSAISTAEANDLAQSNAAKLTGYQMTTAQRAAEEADRAATAGAEDRRLQAAVSAEGVKHAEQQTNLGLILGRAATAKGYPVNSAGMVDMNALSPAQKKDLITTVDPWGVKGAASYGMNDTKRFTTTMRALTKDFTPEAVSRNTAFIEGKFSTANQGLPIGTDKARIEETTAKNDVQYAEQAANNWSVPGSQDAKNSYTVLAAQVDKMDLSDSNRASVNQYMQKFATEGLKLKDGTVITPSVNDVLSAIRATTDGFGPDGWDSNLLADTHGRNVMDLLRETLSTPEAKQRMAEGEKAAQWQRTQKAKQKLAEARKAK